MIKVLFLDRDGIINCVVKNNNGEYDSPQNVGQVSLVERIDELINWANRNSVKVIEITNQPGVAKGKMSMDSAVAIENEIDRLLKIKGVWIDHKYTCYHHSKGVVPELTIDCMCRKPKSGLLTMAAKELNIDLNNSVMLGDRDWDVMAGKAVGCKTIIYLFNEDSPEKLKFALDADADYKIWSIAEALPIVKDLLVNP